MEGAILSSNAAGYFRFGNFTRILAGYSRNGFLNSSICNPRAVPQVRIRSLDANLGSPRPNRPPGTRVPHPYLALFAR